jgi:hypothetical protein
MTVCCPFCGAEYAPTNARCHDCQLGLDPLPPATLPDEEDEELVYELADWPVHARVRLSSTLIERQIPYRWEPGPDLIVRDLDGDGVDALIDELELAAIEGEDEGQEDEDEEWGDAEEHEAAADAVAQAAMADLFVAADRLMHEPGDPRSGDDLVQAAGIVDESPAPFGIEPQTWTRVRELAGAVRERLSEDGTDEDAVAVDAQALRDTLRPFV